MDPFEQIYDQYFKDVYHYLLALCHDENTAKELCAQTFFKAMQAWPTFRRSCPVKYWLMQIARNAWVDLCRKEKDLPLPQEPAGFSDPEAAWKNKESRSLLYERLHQLEQPYQEIFLLRALGNLDFAEIGRLFGKSGNWACVSYHRARKKLIERMKDDEI